MYQLLNFRLMMKALFICVGLFFCMMVFNQTTLISSIHAQDAKRQDAKKQDAKKQDAKKQDAKKQDAKKSKKKKKQDPETSTTKDQGIGVITGIEKPKPTLQSLFSNFQNSNTSDAPEIFKGSDTQNVEHYFQDDAQMELLILGPTHLLNGSFGHVALKVNVTDAWSNQTQEWIYDLGQSKEPSLHSFLFDKPEFEIKKFKAKEMIQYWQTLNRTIIKIPLNLSHHLIGKLYLDLEKLVDQTYRYHPFRSNCVTNIRDLLDRHLHGKIFEITQIDNHHRISTDRILMRSALKNQISMSWMLELFGGTLLDQPKNLWEMGYHPDGLWQLLSQVQLNGQNLLGDAQIIHEGKGMLHPSWLTFGQILIYLVAMIFLVIGFFVNQQSGMILVISKTLLIFTLVTFSLFALWLNLESSLLELRALPALLAFLPTDLMLIFWPILTNLLSIQNHSIALYFKLRMFCLAIVMCIAFLWIGLTAIQFSVLIIAISALFAGQKLFQEE
jgi:hypothetical protein